MERTDIIHKDDGRRIKIVDSLDALFAEDFSPAVNAFVYPRTLTQNFNALARRAATILPAFGKVNLLDYDGLQALGDEIADPAERAAMTRIQRDVDDMLDLFRPGFMREELRLVRPWARGDDTLPENEVFHADGEPGDEYFENILCSYNGPSTQYLHNEDAIAQGNGCYRAARGAVIHSFGLGHIWRIAIAHDQSHTLPLIHRAPRIVEPDHPRLLLTVLRGKERLWTGSGI